MEEYTGYMEIEPNSSFTIGDLVEISIKQYNGSFVKEKGRITNDYQNNWLVAIIVDGLSVTSYYLDKIEYKDIKVIEKGPWHNIICGDK